MSIKTKASTAVVTSKRIASNGESLVQAISLLVVAGFSYWALHQIQTIPELAQWVVTGALVVIGLRGFYEFFKFLDKQ